MNALAYTGLKRSAMYPVYGLAEGILGGGVSRRKTPTFAGFA